jgi:hypothetical protein
MQIKNKKYLIFISLTGSLFIFAQLIAIIFQGNALCLNEGCNVVKSFIKISPFAFNLIGLIFFQLIFWMTHLSRPKPESTDLWLSAFLLAGTGAEATLLAFQFFAAKSFCSYCLIIFCFVLAMNLIGGLQQLIKSVSILIGILIISSQLSYESINSSSGDQSIMAGTYASLISTKQSKKEHFLIISENCPHCHNVINALTSNNNCNFNFNPVDSIQSLELPNLKLSQSFSPQINRNFLALIGIKTVPVLLAQNIDGYTIIKKEENIIKFIHDNCLASQKKSTSSVLPYIPEKTDQDSQFYLFPNEGECSIDVDCKD